MNDHIRTVCKIGQGKLCCRYLVMGTLGFECVKNTSLRSTLDNRVDMNAITAQGDNCEGQSINFLNDNGDV